VDALPLVGVVHGPLPADRLMLAVTARLLAGVDSARIAVTAVLGHVDGVAVGVAQVVGAGVVVVGGGAAGADGDVEAGAPPVDTRVEDADVAGGGAVVVAHHVGVLVTTRPTHAGIAGARVVVLAVHGDRALGLGARVDLVAAGTAIATVAADVTVRVGVGIGARVDLVAAGTAIATRAAAASVIAVVVDDRLAGALVLPLQGVVTAGHETEQETKRDELVAHVFLRLGDPTGTARWVGHMPRGFITTKTLLIIQSEKAIVF